MIRNIQLYHAGKYICVVDTDVESLSAVAVLIVKGKKNLLSALQSLIKTGLTARIVPPLFYKRGTKNVAVNGKGTPLT